MFVFLQKIAFGCDHIRISNNPFVENLTKSSLTSAVLWNKITLAESPRRFCSLGVFDSTAVHAHPNSVYILELGVTMRPLIQVLNSGTIYGLKLEEKTLIDLIP